MMEENKKISENEKLNTGFKSNKKCNDNSNNNSNKKRIYVAIDLKSFYASVECVERGLDPLKANLVVADSSRTSKTICLAVTPNLKKWGIPGRARLFEVEQKVKEVNNELEREGKPKIEYIVAKPRMQLYMDISVKIFEIYQKYVSPEDMHVYSVDELFIDVTEYLNTYKMTARQLAMTMIKDVYKTTGITATCGIGTNMYLCKIAMDIVAKHMKADEDGVRIAQIDELSYRKLLWDHRPITDFWRVGRGYAKKLEQIGLYTMGDVARCSIGKDTDFYNENLLYSLFGVNAELLIDHAWGYENCTIKDVKAYRPDNNSLSVGQVLQRPYKYDEAMTVISEMAEKMAFELMSKKLMSNQVVVTVGYDIDNILDNNIAKTYKGEKKKDYYGRVIPKHAHGTASLGIYTNLSSDIINGTLEVFKEKVDKKLHIRRMTVCVNNVIKDIEGERLNEKNKEYEQLDLFSLFADDKVTEEKNHSREDEKNIQEAVLKIKEKYGSNAILKGTNFKEGATAIERNKQIGGHKA